MTLKKIRAFFTPDHVAIFVSLLFSLAGSLISLHQFWQYSVFFYDFGIFDMAIWRVAHFQAPIIEHFIHGGQWILGDHFNPTIFLLSPLYWITDRSEIILIAQACLFGLAGFILYLIGNKVTKNGWYSLTVLSCFFLFVGVQNAIITDFHEVSLSVIFFLLTFYAFLTKKKIWFWTFFFLFLGTKESNFAVGSALGLTLFLLDRKSYKRSFVVILSAIIYGLLVTKFAIPFFSQNSYSYGVPISYNPFVYIEALFNNPQKIHTLFYSFASFGFLPLLSPVFYFLMLTEFLSRFYPPFLTISWSMAFHYSGVTAAILGLSSMYAYLVIKKIIQSRKVFIILCIAIFLNAVFLYRFVLRGPFGLFYNSAFYEHSKDFEFLNKPMKLIPPSASVATHNNLAVRFTHQNIHLLRSGEIPNTDYVIIDARDGQNPNNFYGVSNIQNTLNLMLQEKKYKIIYHEGDQYVFKRK
ncbi:MAG: DUF2079 domain-containing protein [Candidatus Levybacteria bacterium]|nr:DUF2079 domain-containing protein [Candidatus Levybacteria bacterium]